MYHVLDRGNRRKTIFRNEEDRRRFLAHPGRGVRANGLADSCVCSHEQSLSFARGNAGSDPVAGMKGAKNDARKVVIARWARRHTVATDKWIAKRLWIGDATGVSRYCGNGATLGEPRLRRKLEKPEEKTICTDRPFLPVSDRPFLPVSGLRWVPRLPWAISLPGLWP